MTVLAFAVSAGAQNPAAVARGTRLRLNMYSPDKPFEYSLWWSVVGRYDRVERDTVYLAMNESGPAQYFGTDNVRTVERYVGQRHPYRTRVPAGFGAGYFLGYMYWRITRFTPAQETCYRLGGTEVCTETKPAHRAAPHAVYIGASVGTLAGMVLGRRSSEPIWKLISLSDLR